MVKTAIPVLSKAKNICLQAPLKSVNTLTSCLIRTKSNKTYAKLIEQSAIASYLI